MGAADLSAIEMADYLEVDVATVSRWLNGRRRPGKQTLRLWALRTGAPLEYLESGRLPNGPGNSEKELRFDNSHRAIVTQIFGQPIGAAA